MHLLYTLYLVVLLSFVPYSLRAETTDQFSVDKQIAMGKQSKKLGRTCLADFEGRLKGQSKLEPLGGMEFSDYLTQETYKTLYWKGSDRGVAFVMPVRVHDPKKGPISADIGCFYALTETGLAFQLSQQILRRI